MLLTWWLFFFNPTFPSPMPTEPAEVAVPGYDFSQSVFLRDTLAQDLNGNGLFDPGDRIHYEATLTNRGQDPGPLVAFALESFDQSDFVPGSVSASRGIVVTDAEGVLVRIYQVLPGEEIRISFDAVLRGDATGQSSVQAAVHVLNHTFYSDDPDTEKPLDPTITPLGVSDFTNSVTLRDSLGIDHNGNGLFDPGDRIHYEARVTNAGDQTAEFILFLLRDFDQSSFVPGSVKVSRGFIVSNQLVRVQVGQVLPGETIEISFDADLLPDASGFHQVQALVRDEGTHLETLSDDPDTPQPSDPTRTPIGAQGFSGKLFLQDSLALDVNGNGLFDGGDTIRYVTTLTNEGTTTEPQIHFQLADFDQAELVDGSAEISRGEILSSSGELRARVLDVLPGETITLTCEALLQPDASGTSRVQGLIEVRDGTRFVSDDPDTVAPDDPTLTPIAESTGSLFLYASLTDLLDDHDHNGRPSLGDGLTLLAEIGNLGPQPLTGAVYRLPIDSHISPLPGSLIGNGEVVTFTPTFLEVALAPIPPGGVATLAFDAEIVAVGRFQHQGVISTESEETLTDDPETLVQGDPTVTEAAASVPAMNGTALALFAVGLLSAGAAYRRRHLSL